MTRQEMIDLVGWRYQTMTVEEQNILSRIEHIVKVAVLREQDRCCKIIYSMAGSDNVAQRTVDAIRGQK